MAKSVPQLDVLVLGQHPCAYLAADMLLASRPSVSVMHATIPGDAPPDRQVLVNPELFDLHKPLEKLRKKLELTPVWGCAFLSDEAPTRGEWRVKSATAPASYVSCFSDIRKQFCQLAKESGVKCSTPKSLTIHHVDEKGFEVTLDDKTIRPRAILLAGHVSGENAKVLALPEAFSSDVMRRYSFLRLRNRHEVAHIEEKPLMPMSLDVGGQLTWAWTLIGEDEVQLAVEQPLDEVGSHAPQAVMQIWAASLRKHGILKKQAEALPLDDIKSMDLPAAGALAREIVANRTLLFGPAGGFYTACLEDIYPCCWSALFAVDAIRIALLEPHLQDALQPYRQSWGTTLGEYLRGPQQNLRFLLPLVYRNPVMTGRLAESILQGKSVVR
jgi:hypothetical protein